MVNKVKVDGIIYEINTSYKVALKCEEVAQDEEIGDVERGMAIIYLLYGNKGLNKDEHHKELLTLGLRYLNHGKEFKKGVEESNMDFKQDEGYIYASFMSEYRIDLEKTDMHYWRFLDLLNGLTEDAVLNRVRAIRDIDLGEITDNKERQKIVDAKESVKLEKKLTKEQQEALDKINKLIGKE